MREDVQRVLDEYKIKTFGNKKDLARAEELLDPDETVLFASPSNVVITHANTRKRGTFPGVVFLTDKRFLFSYKVLSNFSVENVSLNEIQSVDCSGNGLTGSSIGVHTLTKSFSVMVTYKREIAQKILKVFEDAKNSVSTIATPASAADEILKYKNLLDCGAITETEFEAKKKQLLGI